MKITLPADVSRLNELNAFLEKAMKDFGASSATVGLVLVAAEEVFANIANYAYNPDKGDVQIAVDSQEGKARIVLAFADSGSPFNPLEKEDPDITLSADEREVGGLGIFMVKNMMDDVTYKREDGKNVLTLIKELN
jgi:anti-sigma regulatory factor (Ser/Thr protein kinase)